MQASRVEADDDSLPSSSTWRGRDDSRTPATPGQARGQARCAARSAPPCASGTFGICIEQAHIGDGTLMVVGGERGLRGLATAQ